MTLLRNTVFTPLSNEHLNETRKYYYKRHHLAEKSDCPRNILNLLWIRIRFRLILRKNWKKLWKLVVIESKLVSGPLISTFELPVSFLSFLTQENFLWCNFFLNVDKLDPDPHKKAAGSALSRSPGSESAKNECGSTDLVLCLVNVSVSNLLAMLRCLSMTPLPESLVAISRSFLSTCGRVNQVSQMKPRTTVRIRCE